MKKAVLTVIFTAILFIILLHTAPARASAVTEPELTNNDMSDDTPVFRHDYTIRASAAGMYLASNSTGYIRIEHMPQKTLIEQYDFNFQFQWKQYIADELERFGGFYAGKDHYFLVYGQYNPNEEDTKEVIRVVKYDLNWNRPGSASIFGEQVWKPFAFGSLQMVEYGGYLYIRTCREMYQSTDGLHHQTNLSLQMRISDMQFVPNVKNTTYYSEWDVSHSFNQFILIDDAANIVTLDHGDANPRSAVLGVFSQKAGADEFALKGFQRPRVPMMSFGGKSGQNLTKASIGALAYSPETYLAAGCSIDQQKDWENGNIRNVFVFAVPRNDLQQGSVKTNWLTSYPEGGSLSASNPYLVKMGERFFLLLWEELSGNNEYGGASPNGRLFYVYLDQNGMPTSQVYTVEGHLSDCNPIVVNQTAVWYVTSREGLRFYTIDGMGNFHTIDVIAFSEKVRDFAGYVAESGNIFLEWKPVPGAKGYHILRRLIDKESYIVYYYEVSSGKSNCFTDKNEVGGIGLGYFEKGGVYEYFIYAHNGRVWSKASDPLYITYEIPKSGKKALKTGKKYEVQGLLYQYQGSSFKLAGVKKTFQKTTVKIPAKITVSKKTYPVTAIGANVFKNNKKIKQVVLGKNIASIGKNAFSGCKSLSKITIKSTKLTDKKIAKNAFQKPGGGSSKKVTVELPKKKYREYKKLLKKRIIHTKKVKLSYKKI